MNVGILGHVDAGKTTLSKALSTIGSTASFDKGAKAANLRANTIDLGFSAIELDDSRKLALIDCPGHAQLISSALVASSVFDGAIVVINGVKGIEPQTAEHLILASILCPDHVIIIISKIDLIEDIKLKTMIKKLPKLLKSLNIREDSSIIPLNLLSLNNSESIQDLLNLLKSFYYIPNRNADGKFVMAVDHCFPIKGKGTIMTGTVIEGICRIGMEIEIPELNEKRKIKELQSWKKPVDEAKAGERAAILLSNLSKTENIDRTLIFEPNALTSVKCILTECKNIEQFKGTLKNKTKIHLTIGFYTVMAECTFLKKDEKEEEYEFTDGYVDGVTHVLMNLQKKIFIKEGQISLAARLDNQKMIECRFAFYGKVITASDDLEALNVRRFHRREKLGIIERWDKDDDFIISGLFKKETKIELFQRMNVLIDDKYHGFIEGSFGKSGKTRIVVKCGTEEIKEKLKNNEKINVLLKMKKYSDGKLLSYL